MTYAFKRCGYPDDNPQKSFTTYVTDYVGPPIDNDSNPLGKKVRINFVDSKKTKVWIENPVLTDVTQIEQCDLKHILQANPDINGLSLLLDDPSLDSMQDNFHLEDFLEPSGHIDIFDLDDFMKRTRRSFMSLPASLRKEFNNSPLLLAQSLNDSSRKTETLALLQKYFNPLIEGSQSSGTPSVDRDEVSAESVDAT